MDLTKTLRSVLFDDVYESVEWCTESVESHKHEAVEAYSEVVF